MDRSNILIVDDAELNRELLSDILKDSYNVYTANDGLDAITKLQSYDVEMSVILLDLNMPKMNGFEVLEYLKNIKHILIYL